MKSIWVLKILSSVPSCFISLAVATGLIVLAFSYWLPEIVTFKSVIAWSVTSPAPCFSNSFSSANSSLSSAALSWFLSSTLVLIKPSTLKSASSKTLLAVSSSISAISLSVKPASFRACFCSSVSAKSSFSSTTVSSSVVSAGSIAYNFILLSFSSTTAGISSLFSSVTTMSSSETVSSSEFGAPSVFSVSLGASVFAVVSSFGFSVSSAGAGVSSLFPSDKSSLFSSTKLSSSLVVSGSAESSATAWFSLSSSAASTEDGDTKSA